MTQAKQNPLHVLLLDIKNISTTANSDPYPSDDEYWKDLRTTLGELRISSDKSSIARGRFLTIYADAMCTGVSGRDSRTGQIDIRVTFFPYNDLWALVRGVNVTLVGRTRDGSYITPKQSSVNWEGVATFANLRSGEYQVLLSKDLQAYTIRESRNLLQRLDPTVEGYQGDSNEYVSVDVTRRNYRSHAEIECCVTPRSPSVNLTGQVYALQDATVNDEPRRKRVRDSSGLIVFARVEPRDSKYIFTEPFGMQRKEASPELISLDAQMCGPADNPTNFRKKALGDAGIRGLGDASQPTNYPEWESPGQLNGYLWFDRKERAYKLRIDYLNSPSDEPEIHYQLGLVDSGIRVFGGQIRLSDRTSDDTWSKTVTVDWPPNELVVLGDRCELILIEKDLSTKG